MAQARPSSKTREEARWCMTLLGPSGISTAIVVGFCEDNALNTSGLTYLVLEQCYSSSMERVVCTCGTWIMIIVVRSRHSKENTPQIWRARSLLHFVVATEFVSQVSRDAEYSVVGDA